MSGLPIKYRVRLAFGFYRVGYEFMSPPMSRGYAQELVSKGFLEVVKDGAVNTADLIDKALRKKPKKYR